MQSPKILWFIRLGDSCRGFELGGTPQQHAQRDLHFQKIIAGVGLTARMLELRQAMANRRKSLSATAYSPM
jgi:hypothetical protein